MIKKTNDINILHDWEALIFWLHKIRPDMLPGNGVTLINRLKNALSSNETDIIIDDIPESTEDLKMVIDQYMEVVNKHREFISYWTNGGLKDERLKEYNYRVRTVSREELKELLSKEKKVLVRDGKIVWGVEII